MSYAVSQLGYDRIEVGYSSYIPKTGGTFSDYTLSDGTKIIRVQLDALNGVQIGGRTMSAEEIIFHEVSHAIANFDNFYDPEQAAVRFTNGFRSEVGIEYRGDYHDGAFVPRVGQHPNLVLDNRCFLAGTMIDMWPLDVPPDADGIYDEKELLAKVWKKPIEEIAPEDWVVSYDDKGRLKPGRVTRTFQNHSKHILDVHGLMVTPGHATYCAKVESEENRFADSHVPIIDILRSDGALKMNDGTLIRAATDCVVGSKDDEQFWAFLLYEDKDGAERVREKCQLRLGSRWMMPNGNHFSMREYMNSIGVELIEDGPQKGNAPCGKGLLTQTNWSTLL